MALRDSLGSISVVVPAFNAAPFVAATIRDVRDYLERASLPYEIIVVDDGSGDRTAQVAEPLSRVIRSETNCGKGHAVRRGMLAARHDWVVFMDADHSTRIENLDRFAAETCRADVIIASRRAAGARIMQEQPRLRQALGRTFPYLVRAVALPGIMDSQCGFKLFRREAAEQIFSRQTVDRFAFDVEVLLLARRLGLRIVEVPVDWFNPPTSSLRIGRDSLGMFIDVIKLAWRFRGGGGGRG